MYFRFGPKRARKRADFCHGTKMADHSSTGDARRPHSGSQLRRDLSGDLATMARRTGLDTLGYLLEMVRLEAESVARHMPHSGGR